MWKSCSSRIFTVSPFLYCLQTTNSFLKGHKIVKVISQLCSLYSLISDPREWTWVSDTPRGWTMGMVRGSVHIESPTFWEAVRPWQTRTFAHTSSRFICCFVWGSSQTCIRNLKEEKTFWSIIYRRKAWEHFGRYRMVVLRLGCALESSGHLFWGHKTLIYHFTLFFTFIIESVFFPVIPF